MLIQISPARLWNSPSHGRFIGQFSVDPALGGAFGLNIVRVSDDVVRFAAVDDNANNITIWMLNAANLIDSNQD